MDWRSAKPDFPSVFKKPDGLAGPAPRACTRTAKWVMLRCLLTPADGADYGGRGEMSRGAWAPVEIGTMLVVVARLVKEPAIIAAQPKWPNRSGESEPPRSHLPRQRLT